MPFTILYLIETGAKMINKLTALFKKGKDIHPPLKENGKNTTSIAFISLHKCATSFFSRTVLKELKELALVNYQSYEYLHEEKIAPIIKPEGYIYAVLRLYDRDHPGYKLTNELINPSNLKKIKTIFWVRDPRDILVSLYYSFGFTHPESPNQIIKAHQHQRREKIQKMSLDEYALNEAPNLQWKFEQIDNLREQLPDHLFMRYEEMIHNFDPFFQTLSDFTGLDKNLYKQMYQQTRPNESEDTSKHKRSGKTQAYLEKLKPETIEMLNSILAPTLEKFGYVV